MSKKKNSKPSPVECVACGRIFTLDQRLEGRLCLQCSRPVTNAEYMARRYEGMDRVTGYAGYLWQSPPQQYFPPQFQRPKPERTTNQRATIKQKQKQKRK